MSAHCCDHTPQTPPDTRFRRVLWIALIANLAMFTVEIGGGLAAQSASLKADALDFLGDAATYGISLYVLALAASWQSRAAYLKGLSMAAFGIYVIGDAAHSAIAGTVPEPLTMGVIGTLALATNVGVAVMLYRFREGDANRRSVWLCSRNDAISNVAVLLAASGVFTTSTGWPDVAVAAIMAGLALWSSAQVLRQARGELRGIASSAA